MKAITALFDHFTTDPSNRATPGGPIPLRAVPWMRRREPRGCPAFLPRGWSGADPLRALLEMSGRLEEMKFPKDVIGFYLGVSRLAARARARGDMGQDGNPIWSTVEWQAFCRGVRSYSHTRSLGLGMAAYKTAVEVEAMIADGFSAGDIHSVLMAVGTEAQIKANAQRESSRRDPVYHQAYLVDDDQT